MMGSVTTQPLFSFGVIADVQYADIPDGRSFLGTPRYYRNSILVLQKAVQAWNQHGNLKFVINMGDIVDGFCPKDQSLSATKKLVNEFDNFQGPVYHMIGNHCLYNLPRQELLPLLNIPRRDDDNNAYYDFSPTPEYRVVVLDGYDISAVGWPEDHPKTLAALKILEEKNPNLEKNSPEGLVDVERRFVKYNGGVGEKQLEWLDGVLGDATELNQKVIVCGHVPMSPGAASKAALLWNFDEVMSVIHKYDVVKVCLSGHDHKGGYFVDSHGVHHRSLEAALECPPGIKIFCFGMLRVRDRHFVFRFRCSRPALVSGVAFVHPMSVWLCIWEVMASIAFASLALFPGIGVLVNAISPALFDRCFKFFSSPSTLDLIL
ncbi:hypothetical protein N665_0008s0110 [Sinapis alba]|nr:hypothetical protein N665_0008s0110 [Sinapis alba]